MANAPSLLELAKQDNAETASGGGETDAGISTESTTVEETTTEAAGDLDTTQDTKPAEGEQADGHTEGGKEETTETDDADASAIRDYFKESLGDESHAWIDQYQNDDELVKGVGELQKLLGRRTDDGNVAKWLRDNNITASDVQGIIDERQSPPAKSNETSTKDEWNPEWAAFDKQGTLIPTASAPADFEARAEKRMAMMREAFLDPAKMYKNFIQPHLEKELAASAGTTQEETAQQIAEVQNTQRLETWKAGKHNLLFVEGTENPTPLGAKVHEYLTAGRHPKLGVLDKSKPWDEQADVALAWATADSQPKQPIEKTVPAKAKHQVAPAKGTAQKLSPAEFFKKYGTDLQLFTKYMETGELPVAD